MTENFSPVLLWKGKLTITTDSASTSKDSTRISANVEEKNIQPSDANGQSDANDYLKKPFSMQELILRIKALVGKAYVRADETAGHQRAELIRIGDYMFTPVPQTLTYVDGSTAELSHRESEILYRLCSATGHVVETRSLLIDLWGNDSYFNTRSLHVFITKLRRHLRRDTSIRIINVRGIGYKMVGSE